MSKALATPTDAAYIARLREDYPEKCDGLNFVRLGFPAQRTDQP